MEVFTRMTNDDQEVKRYLVIVHNDARGRWQFKYQGAPLSWWKLAIIRLVGWEASELP